VVTKTKPSVAAPLGEAAPVSLRLLAALAAGKMAARASRALGRGGGTSLPGSIARRIAPAVLDTIVRRHGVPVVVITGSNGKTTTARFTAALLRGESVAVSHDPAGANLVQSVTSLAVNFADLRGRLPPGVLVAEVDEGALAQVVPELAPQVVLVTDLFRDQLDRYGELYAVANAIESVILGLPEDAAWVVNADDPLASSMAVGAQARRLTFGLDLDRDTDRITRAADTIRCPRCHTDLTYRHVYLSHLGDYRCAACGFTRPDLDVAVTDVAVERIDLTRLTVRLASGEALTLVVPQGGIHIAYDVAAALAILVALGVAPTHAAESLAAAGPAFGRLEQIAGAGPRIILGFAKNPTSFNTNLRTLASEGEPRHLLVAASNTLVDGEDFAWLWDVDFESAVDQIQHVTVSGTRADELANRVKYAGVAPSQIAIHEKRRDALDAALARVPAGGTLTILAGYTPTIEFRDEMRRRGWVGRYWLA
jgi:lipid II isoglutaminyl synthase (glutamine-hydrolysing)